MNKTLSRLLAIILVLTIIFIFFQLFPIVYGILRTIFNILIPFTVGFLFAFMLHTLVEKLEKLKIKRIIAVIIVFVILIGAIVVTVVTIIPLLITQISDLITNLDEYSNMICSLLKNVCTTFKISHSIIPENEIIRDYFNSLFVAINSSLLKFLSNTINNIDVIILTPIVTFYMLYEYPDITKNIVLWLRKNNHKLMEDFLFDVDKVLGDYFRGMLVVMLILTCTTSILFLIVGLDYAILFGLLIGVTNIIPIFGQYIGGIVVSLFALTQSFKLMVTVAVIILILQLIESNFLTPYVQSKTSNYHPILILLAFVVFGKFFGLVGMIFSIPLFGGIVLTYKYLKKYFMQRKNLLNKNTNEE